MALTAPTPPTPPTAFTPPTPPTPPSAPTITFGGGGSVTETTEPQGHGPMTDDALHEQQARKAVANGSGPLSKTVVSDPKEKKQEGAPQQGREEKTPRQEPTSVQPPASGDGNRNQATLRQEGPSSAVLGDSPGQGSQVKTETAARIPESPSYHGMLYWGGMLAVIAILVAIFLRTVLFRKTGGADTAPKERAAEPEVKPRAGMTAGDVLREIEAKETRQTMAPPRHVAREYASQAAAKPADKKSRASGKPAPKPAPRPVRQGKKEGEERERFEVRI